MNPDFGQNWHTLSQSELLDSLGTSLEQGVDTQEVSRRREQSGANIIARQVGKSPLVLFLLQFHQPLVYILLAAGLTTALLKEWVDATVILGVVLVNAIIGYLQESKATRAIEALSHALVTTATVIRGGDRRQIHAEELLPGDIVLLQSGDRVPADMRLISSRELQIDESPLTGESVPAHKNSGILPMAVPLSDRTNMAYSSTLVTYGVATGVVVATGDHTEIGRINRLIASADLLATPLTRKISHFSKILLYVILTLSAVTFLVGVLRGFSYLHIFMAVVALAVGAIPEGLPAAVTITLAIGVAKMARHNAIIRKLPAVETLGSTTVICSDKTGTLTRNQMTVSELYAGNDHILLSGAGYTPEGIFTNNGMILSVASRPALHECLLAGALCNDASLFPADGEWKIEGDPTEAALLISAHKAGIQRQRVAMLLPRIDVIPFESEYQYMATLHEKNGEQVVYLKGAVESILPRCIATVASDGAVTALDSSLIHGIAEEMALKGLRILAFARLERHGTTGELLHEELSGGLTFLGLQGMIDPARDEAITAIQNCKNAGIMVKMITGDHAITAAAIARHIGLVDDNHPIDNGTVLTGGELELLSDRELIEAAEQTVVFARVAPEQKLRLVKALQNRGHIVAMTGDGVNDAPALRQADIGVAMGITGTEVAREAADMVLTDDNFSSIKAAVAEGRGVYDNLVKFIIWTLPTNLGEGLVIMAAVFAGAELPILPVQILWINMTTAVLLGLMLAFEPKEHGIMQRRPLKPDKPLLTMELLFRIGLVGLLLLAAAFGIFEWELSRGGNLEQARSCAVNAFVFGEIFYLFNCRSLRQPIWKAALFSNIWLLWGVGIMVFLQILFTYTPFMNIAFGSRPIGLLEWLAILGTSLITCLVIEIEKSIRRHT